MEEMEKSVFDMLFHYPEIRDYPENRLELFSKAGLTETTF